MHQLIEIKPIIVYSLSVKKIDNAEAEYRLVKVLLFQSSFRTQTAMGRIFHLPEAFRQSNFVRNDNWYNKCLGIFEDYAEITCIGNGDFLAGRSIISNKYREPFRIFYEYIYREKIESQVGEVVPLLSKLRSCLSSARLNYKSTADSLEEKYEGIYPDLETQKLVYTTLENSSWDR